MVLNAPIAIRSQVDSTKYKRKRPPRFIKDPFTLTTCRGVWDTFDHILFVLEMLMCPDASPRRMQQEK